ncbi:uncharacterized protein LOC123542856 [Mercenaria mercenaria]|uniref:uncharacterized protein LOC123542856 n=1 Tax=Mercenaria mercenaria TaxID=6596 RepID=UPI00234E9908|nr:uncharacterized protein LOC123542856 [Mercenaria mercenaria]
MNVECQIKYKKMKDKIFALFISTCLAFSAGQIDTSVCTGQIPGPNDPPGPPSLPNVFEVHVEANINNRNYTSEYHIWYDQLHNQVATHVDNAGTRTEDLYRFDTNEFYHVDRDNGICTVQPLFRSPQLFLFGTATGDKATMKTPNQFLHFNETGIQQKWINQTVVRGITCNLWRSCLYWDSIKATMVVDWYFSAPSWTTSRLSPQLPVRAHVYGKTVMQNGKKRPFDHMYEFADFNPNPGRHTSAYQTPTGVYCPRAKNIKPLPTPSSSFHFTAEIIFGQSISRIKEWYDNDMNLVRYDYDPLGTQKYGTLPLTQVHDFNTGVAYIIDSLRGNCTATPISNTGFDVRNADPTHVRIRTSKEFFYFDKAAYIYEGQRSVRSIKSDVWIAQRNDWPVPNSPNSTWEWYFATPNYTSNFITVFGNPTRMVLDAGLGQHYVYNIYDYNERRPMIWSYDIGNCFNYTERQDFSFKLPGSYRKLVNGNMELFRYAVLRAIVKAGTINKINLSPLRVYNIQIDYADNNDIIVQFTLLDKAPQLGDVSNPKPENSLKVVAKSISGAINGGQLIVRLQVPLVPPANMVARQYSLSPGKMIKDAYYKQTKQGASTSTGVSGGAMAGMGVALLVVFFVIGVAATYFYYRRQGGAFGPKKFGDEDITSSDT